MRILILLSLFATGLLARPSLTGVYPRGAGQGETIEVRLIGTGLSDATDILFYDEGIELVKFTEVDKKTTYERADGRDTRLNASAGALATLKIATDCRPGEHHLRVVAPDGASILRTFWVGTFPSFAETEGYPVRNHVLEAANELPALPVTVNGRLWRYDTDLYKFEGKKGQNLTVEIEGERLANHTAGGITDLILELCDAEGRTIIRTEDSAMFLADPVLRATIPEDGTYHIKVETQVPGADSSVNYYRMHVGDFDRVVPVPAGGKAREADPSLPTPNPYRVSELPNVVESEPNDTPDEAGAASAFPVAFNGRMDKADDIDVYRFKVPAGETAWKLVLHGQSIGSAIDATMELHRIETRKGKTTSRRLTTAADSRPEHRGMARLSNRMRDLLDPVVLIKANKADVEYELHVKDAHGRHGHEFVYRVEAEAVQPGFRVTIPQYGNNASSQIRNRMEVAQGASYPTWISVTPLYGSPKLEGRARIEAVGLPKGMRFEAPLYGAGTERVAARFVCDGQVKPGAHLVRFEVVPEDMEGEFVTEFQQVLPFYTRQNSYAQYHTFVDELALVVTEAPPFQLKVDPPDAALVQNGEYKIPFEIVRKDGFDGMVEVTMELVPPNVNRSTPVKVKAGETKGEFVLSASSRTEAKSYEVMLSAVYNQGNNRNARYGAGDIVLASELFEINVGKPYIVARLSRAAVERGKESTVTARLTHQRPLKGKARATLKGLPRGIELLEEYVPVGAEDETVTFKIKATPDALFGMNRGLHCIFEIEEKGETLKQKTGYGYLRIDPERNQTSSVK